MSRKRGLLLSVKLHRDEIDLVERTAAAMSIDRRHYIRRSWMAQTERDTGKSWSDFEREYENAG